MTRLLQLIAGVRREKVVIDLSTDAATVITGRHRLIAVFATTALSAHAVTIGDDDVDLAVIPASTTAGTVIDLAGMPVATNITVTPNASSTGTIVLVYESIDG